MANTPVKILKSDGRSVLIEWRDDGGIHRGTVPMEVMVGDDLIPDEYLTLAIPYGVDWAYVFHEHASQVTPEQFATIMRQYGIWTLKDLIADPNHAHAAIQAIYGLDYQMLVKFARSLFGGGI